MAICLGNFFVLYCIYFLKPFLIDPSLIGNLTFIFGAFLLFRCFITSGADPLTFSYYRNGNLTQSSSNVKTETNYKFTFLGLQKNKKKHGVEYIFKVTNRYGKDRTAP